ncbi:Plasmodium exported protein (hyp10), unknown function [Plasmodium sp. gorilla clade G2]|uniref:Plasmodium exported protein (hyp10), unknown function n=1 Tax=Plasmodium sp. gorilla clade G2 TaxID=880535 RepID=UPI000D2B9E60|nr:Plasmodium exported protein (hyp10), unknown function [Plasmodium sp. gorilla clade G2]SOV20048.1 Plasmodium exported protein (hyp10), unknown function [Plasmodium sp. gorilla clade G2]
MSCNYFKLSLFSIVLCILVYTHKFPRENIFYNKINTVDIINATPRILLAEAQETDIYKSHSGENALTYHTGNKLDENYTEYHKTSSDCTLNNEILEEYDNQTEQVELGNEKNNKSLVEKSHRKTHCKKIKKISKIALFAIFWEISIWYFPFYIIKRNYKNNK